MLRDGCLWFIFMFLVCFGCVWSFIKQGFPRDFVVWNGVSEAVCWFFVVLKPGCQGDEHRYLGRNRKSVMSLKLGIRGGREEGRILILNPGMILAAKDRKDLKNRNLMY